jgi:hypothetical protein
MRRPSTRAVLLVGVAVVLLLAGVVSAYASGHPDGLEYVASRVGFLDTAADSPTGDSPLAGYAVRGVGSERLSGGLAGVVGVVVVGLLASALTWAVRRRRRED